MPKIKFLDSVKNKKKSLVFTHTEEDIVLNLPKESGILVTDKLAEKKLNEANQGNTQNIIFILKPDITENNGGVTTSNWDEYFKIASYKTSAGFLGKHTGTEWVAYSNSNLTTLVDRSSGNVLHKDKWKPNTNVPNLNLYVRYRFASNNIYSPWSDSIHVVTAPGGISPFDVSVEENTLTPLCTVSAFNAYGNATGANHVSTSWVVYEANGDNLGAKVIESLNDATNKTNFRIPNGKLSADKEYYLQVTLHTDNSSYPNSKAYVRKFTTGSAYIERPVLKYEADNGRHIIKASDFRCSDSSQSLVSGVWKLYNADNNTLINSTTNTSKEYDITIFVNSKKKYYVTLVYKSNTLTSLEGKCIFIVKGSKVDEIKASFDTSTDPSTIKLPILKLSKFYVPSETDSVKSMAYKSIHKDHSVEDQHGWFIGKYNVPMEHTLTRDEYRTLLDLEKEWDNSPLKFKAYIIGNKYNSDMFEATFTPDISLNYKVVKYGESWDDFKIQIVKDDSLNPSNPTPGWIGFDRFYIYGDKITTPIDSGFHYHSEHTPIVAIPNNGYEYNKDYHFTFKIYNSVGVRTIEYTVKMEGGKITDPDTTIEAKHAYGDYVNMKVKGTEYAYSRPIDSTNGLKEIKLTIQDTSDNNKVVYETIQTVADKGPSVYNFDINYDKDHLDKSLKHNTKYLVSIEYKNVRGERSKRASKEFTTLQRDEIVFPNFELSTNVNYVPDSEATSGPYVSYIMIMLGLRIDKKILAQGDPNVEERIKTSGIDKLVYYVKSDTGTVLFQHEIKDDVLRPTSPYNGKAFPETYSSYGNGLYNFDYRELYKDMQQQNKPYVPPLFELNKIYELGCIVYIEDKFKELSKFVVTLPDGRASTYPDLEHTYINNIRTRREQVKKLLITDPGIPSGTAVNVTTAAELMKEYVGPYLRDKVSPIKLTLQIINVFIDGYNKRYSEWKKSYHYFQIITDLTTPSNNKSVFYNVPKMSNDIPNPRNLINIEQFGCVSGTYDYEKMKPIFYVLNQNNKWFLCIKYTLFPKELEHNSDFIYPFHSGWWYTDQLGKIFLSHPYVSLKLDYNYTAPDERVLEFQNEVGYGGHFESNQFIFYPGPIANIKGHTIKTVTTDLFLNNQLELSDISSTGYKIFAHIPYKNYEEQEYDTPYLEQIPYDGCMLIIPVRSYDFLNIPEDPDDNLLVQSNPNIGAHFKFFKINTDGTETPVDNIEDAFSVGVRVGTDTRYDRFGKWTKPVNKRPVLEPGEKYKLKLWFIPFNNKFYSYDYYAEKVFVAYKPSLNYKLIKIGDTWDDFIFQVVKDDSLNPGKPMPNWVTISKIVVSGDRIATPLESTTDKVKIPNNGYAYMEDYNFTIQVYTNAGTKTFNTVVRLDKGIIGTPDITITTKHARDAYINAKVVGSQYVYNMPINNTNDLKSIELTVYELRSDGTVDHKVLDIIQTVSGMTINKVYTFNLNYNKDNLSQSLKHNTNYQFNMVYENIKGEKSLIGIKKIKTPEREIIKPVKPAIRRFHVRSFWERKNNVTISTITDINIDIQNSYEIQREFAKNQIDKLNYIIKALNGTIIYDKSYTIEDYNAGRTEITDPATSLKKLSIDELNYDFGNYIRSLTDLTTYQRPMELGNVYECVVTTYYEDQTSSTNKYELVNTSFSSEFASTLDKIAVDKLPLRLEYQYKTEIPNPGVPSGSVVDITKLREWIKYYPPKHDPNLKLEEFTLVAGGDISYSQFGLYIRTSLVDPSRNAAWIISEKIKDSDKYKKYDTAGNDKVTLSYDDFKPKATVVYENSKWYVVLLYKAVTRSFERTPNFLFPYPAGTFSTEFKMDNIVYKHYGIGVTFDDIYNGMGTTSGKGSITAWAWDIRPFITGPYSNPKYSLVGTEEYSKGQLSLSTVPSADYNMILCTHASGVKSISSSGRKHIVAYPYPTLEYLPINGCCLLMYIQTHFLASAKVAEADNFLVQPHDKTGVHFQIYELKADGSEVLVEGAETAFSVGVYNGTGDKEYLGKWTKPVNRRKVLDHGKLYKLKFHFVPYNNVTYASHFYVEKVFVGY